MSCVPNVASFSGLFVFVLCIVYPILSVSLDCLSSPYVLFTQCCQKQSSETGNIGYTRHKAKTNNPEKLATLGTQDIRRRQTIQRSWQHLFVFVLCLVYLMLPVSLDCLSSSYVLCTQCCQFLWIVCLHLMSCLPNVASFSGLLGTQVIRWRQSRETGNIG
jgi:hypothetical protein